MLQPQASCHQRFALTSSRKGGSRNKFGIVKWSCIGVTICVAMAIASSAQSNVSHPSTTFTDLLNFDGANGEYPAYMSLIQGSNGNLYGTSFGGGTYDDGTIFEITTAGVLTTLYTFCSKTDCADGAGPYAGLVQDNSGNLYGTTVGGGSHFNGTVFKLSSSNKLTTLHSFKGGTTEGAYPFSGLILYNGDYYGTTQAGGANGAGTVFKITTGGTLTTLYSFCSQSECADGDVPYAGLVQLDGNFYGTTLGGGAIGVGTVFEITPAGALTTLYSFTYNDEGEFVNGGEPYGGLVVADGVLYGTTSNFGANNEGGTVFQITPAGTLTTLYSFCAKTNCTDGNYPTAALILGTSGNLYGTTEEGGTDGYGTVFEITTAGKLTTLHDFDITKGAYPNGGLLQDSSGTFYGTTGNGGSYLDGTVYSLSVSSKGRPRPAK